MPYTKPRRSIADPPAAGHPGEDYLDAAERLVRLQSAGYSRAEMAGLTGLTVPQVVERLQLMTLDDGLRRYLRVENVPERTALTLLLVPDEVTRHRLAMRIVRERLCVRDAALLADAANRHCAAMCAERHQRVRIVLRDTRPFHNALRDIAGQMNAAGVKATFTEERHQGMMEMKIAYPLRRRRTERYQSM